MLLNYYETERRQVPLTVAAALARLYGTSLESLLAGEELVGSRLDVSGILFRASPRELGDSARGGLRLFEQRVSEYVELAGEMGVKLPGPGRSSFPAARGVSAKEGAWAARQLRRQLDLGGTVAALALLRGRQRGAGPAFPSACHRLLPFSPSGGTVPTG